MSQSRPFAVSFRRVLYLTVLFREACDYLKAEDETPSGIVAEMFPVQNALKRFYAALKRSSPEDWAMIEADLESDRFSQFGLLLDEIFEVANIDTIRQAVIEWKGPDALKPYQPINQ